jgi:hypothetical protein
VFHRLKQTNKHINDELLYLCFHNNRIKFNNISIYAFLFLSLSLKEQKKEETPTSIQKSHDYNLEIVA